MNEIGREAAAPELDDVVRSLFDSMPHVAWIHRADLSGVVYVNAAYERVFGRPRGAPGAAARAWLDCVHDTDRVVVRDALAARGRGEPRSLGELRVVRPGGEVRWLRCSMRRSTLGAPCFVETALDVTAERAAAEQSRRSRALVDGVVELLGVVVVVADASLRVVSYNDRFAALFGPDAERHRGATLASVICGDDRATPSCADVSAALARGERVSLGVHAYPSAAGGSMELEWRATALHDPGGSAPTVLAVGHDVSSERAERRARRMSDERFGEFVRNLPDVPWLYRVATDELAIVGRYDERHWGRPPPFGPGAARGLIEWVHPDDRAEVFATMSGLAVSAASAVTSHECRVVLPDGRVRWALTRAVPVHDEQGRAVEVAGYTVDVTERRDTELALRDHAVALERLVREKDVLLAEVHHRVKNNLQRITALLHLMAATSHGRSIRETVEELERRIEAMALAHETLYRSADLASVDMQAYLDRVARAQLGATGSPRRSIDVVVRAPDVRLDLDAALRCGLIVTELLSNSLKHAFGRRRRGRVEVALEPDGAGRLVLSVSDDGRGFPEGLGFTSEATLGLRLVGGLADQLGGAARRVRGATARIEIAFPAGG